MRPEVQTFVADGPLPDWDAEEEEIERRVTRPEDTQQHGYVHAAPPAPSRTAPAATRP